MNYFRKKNIFRLATISSMSAGLISLSGGINAEAVSEPTSRIEGDNRFETAAQISKQSYDQSGTVIIANAREFADALAGVPLAYQHQAPILLVQGNKLHSAIVEEIDRLGAEHAIILGGEAAVSEEVYESFQTLGLTTERIAGDNRFETAEKIADSLGEFILSDTAVVVDGFEFADAMSVAPYAAQAGMPIYLTRSTSLSNEEALKDFEKTYVIGGENAVSLSVESQLNNPTRLHGMNRYETNIEVLKHFGLHSNQLFVATGLDFVDALTGAVFAAKESSGVALVRNGLHNDLNEFIEEHSFNKFTILGGHMAVPDVVTKSLTSYLEANQVVTEEVIIENEVVFSTVEIEDDSMASGETYVETIGQNGYDEVKYKVTYANEKEVYRVEIGRRTIDPVDKVVVIGTQVVEILSETTQENEVFYNVTEQEDDSLPRGEHVILVQGENGYDEVTYDVTYINGMETNRIEVARNTIDPVTEEILVGTKDVITKRYSIKTGYSSQGYYRGIFETTYVNGVETGSIKVADIQSSYSSMGVSTRNETIPISYNTEYIYDSNLEEGEEELRRKGENGTENVEYTHIYLDHKLVFVGENKREIIIKPINELIATGTEIVE